MFLITQFDCTRKPISVDQTILSCNCLLYRKSSSKLLAENAGIALSRVYRSPQTHNTTVFHATKPNLEKKFDLTWFLFCSINAIKSSIPMRFIAAPNGPNVFHIQVAQQFYSGLNSRSCSVCLNEPFFSFENFERLHDIF